MLNIYRASAGSGKTYRLTQDYIELLFSASKEWAHRRVMAVTFTNKATDEMKSRILKELYALSIGAESDYRKDLMKNFDKSVEQINEQAKQILIEILHDYSSFSISTIDRFFQQVIRAFAREIGVNGGYNLELDNSQTLEQAIDNMFLDLSKEENRQLLQWLTEYAEERIEQAEGWNLRQSISALGKEIFKENYQHKAESIRQKLHDKEFLASYRKKLRLIQSDFEEKVKVEAQRGLDIMSRYELKHEDFAYSSTKTLDSLLNLTKLEVGKRFISFIDDVTNCYSKSKPQHIKNAIETAYENGLKDCFVEIVHLLEEGIIPYNSVQIVQKHINTLGILSDLAVQIKTLTDEQNTLLISDSNMLLNKIIDDSDAPFVYERTGLNIDHFMIDEFQDTSVLQWKNFHPLLSNSLSSGNTNLVVGDVKQSIYRWRNSDWKLLDERIMTDFGEGQFVEKNLDTNWRSDRNIVDFNNTFFHVAAEALQQKLNAKIETLLPMYPNLDMLRSKIKHAYKDLYQKTKPTAKEGYVRFEFITSEDKEEKWKEKSLNRLPALLEELQDRGYKPEKVCILVRKNDEEQAIVEKLLMHKTSLEARKDYCYDIMGNEGLLIASAASVRFVLALLRLFANPSDSIQQTIACYEYARAKQAKSPGEALYACFSGKPENFKGFSHLFSIEENNAMEEIRYLSLFDMVERIIALFTLGDWYNEAVFVQAFQNIVYQYSTGKTADINSFLSWWDAKGVEQCVSTPEGQQAFRIMTIHKSKGLDFDVVIIPFGDWDLDSRMRNILWCDPKEKPFDELPLLPVEYTSKLEKTIFSEAYFDEQMHLYIDNLNLAYVAFTRAKHELICFAPKVDETKSGNIDKMNSLSTLIDYCLQSQKSSDTELQLSEHFDNDAARFELGKTTKQMEPKEASKHIESKIETYPSVRSDNRLRVRHQSLDYWLENQDISDSRLNYGLIMHDILCQIKQPKDEENAIQLQIRNGRISESDAQYIRDEMETFWQLPQTSEWFSPKLRVLNETSIVTPTGALYRPDRVVVDGNKAIVIDYKFGDKEKSAYLAQVKTYMNLIEQMNYEVSGFVCYVSLRKIVTV